MVMIALDPFAFTICCEQTRLYPNMISRRSYKAPGKGNLSFQLTGSVFVIELLSIRYLLLIIPNLAKCFREVISLFIETNSWFG